jgi:putative ABC transport system ATP-binding protein
MVFQSVMWCSSGRERVVTRLVALVSHWIQLRRRQGSQEQESAPAIHTQLCAPLSSHLPGDEQETQTCKAVIPVTTKDEIAPLIVVHDLEKTYQRDRISWSSLAGISLTIEHGEFVMVTGPAGAGKSTLLHILGCMIQPSAGSYSLAGSIVSLYLPDTLAVLRNQRIGFLFREPALLPHVSALKNVALPLLYAGFAEAEQKRRAQKALEFVGLGSRLLATPEHLSPGQQQRVAIARALVNSPTLLCADDPLGNMDVRSGREIMAVLQALNRRKLTIIMATQNTELAVYAQRHVTLRAGGIVSDTRVSNGRLALDDLATVVEDKEASIGAHVREEAL